MRSEHPDSLQREAENDERIREFASILLRRRGIQDMAPTPLIEEGVLAALRLYVHQRTPAPLPWLADVFTLGSDARHHLLRNCTEPELARKFHAYATMSPTARRSETGPAERILRAVCQSPAFRVRSGGATFDIDRFLDERGILILDGGSQGNLSRDAASVMMGAVILRILQRGCAGSKGRVVVVLDEAVNANLIGVHESRALAEVAKWGISFHVIVQDPFSFPSEEIRQNVLQNTGRHEWFRQGSPDAVRLAAEDVATPLLDPLKVHHTEYRTRTADAGYDRVQTVSRSERTDPEGRTTSRTRSWNTMLWPRRREVRDAQDRYTALKDQVLLMQKELMLLKPGFRFVRSDQVSRVPEYVPMLGEPWAALGERTISFGNTQVPPLMEVKLRGILAEMKQRGMFRTPNTYPAPPSSSSRTPGAARKLANR